MRGIAPRGTRLLQTACRTTIRQRWRPVQLARGMAERVETSRIPALDRVEDLAHDRDVLLDTHTSLLSGSYPAGTVTVPRTRNHSQACRAWTTPDPMRER